MHTQIVNYQRFWRIGTKCTAQKAPTELFIRKFAKIYTPIVVFLAIAICVLPMLIC
jgi:cation transport ATPase